MERIPRGICTQEFREQAVKLVEVEGVPVAEAARRLSFPVGSLKNWLYITDGQAQSGWPGAKAIDRPGTGIGQGQEGTGQTEGGARSAKKWAAHFAKESRWDTAKLNPCDNGTRSRSCAAFWRSLKADTTHGASARPAHVAKKMPDSKPRSRPPTSAPAQPAARSAYRPICRITVFR
jgi:hypothetical protein